MSKPESSPLQKICTTLLVLSMAYCGSGLQNYGTGPGFNYVVNVMKMGAVGDGRKDDSQAFLRAWAAVCGANKTAPLLLIPAGRTFLLKPVKFQGPCTSSAINFKILGNIMAPDMTAWKGDDRQNWLVFENINWLKIDGNGQIDGRGASWWQQESEPEKRPAALTFNKCTNLRLNQLKHINSPRNHITVTGCRNVVISHLNITAPGSSPNTDGIDIGQTRNVYIHDCNIETGDDCIAIGTESFNFKISHVTCGPGHGISIGSLGANGAMARVKNINVSDCSFKGSTNGARIKTWQGGSGFAKEIYFQRIHLDAVANPIIIDQYYCPVPGNCPNQTSAVKVSDVFYNNFEGTSSSEKAIILNCSQSIGCDNLRLTDIFIKSSVQGAGCQSSCLNAQATVSNSVPAVKCLKRK
ncbi:probable polygalacturonase At3g15720 [Pistacia vera]|uniref:probable polygalacturonase At3g15720 n=1 Tax=Pistacia vera TaxID=55513 RepID=UPI00126330E6|nr:probable polygalacturonase At3g15720 [Pistacia vera]